MLHVARHVVEAEQRDEERREPDRDEEHREEDLGGVRQHLSGRGIAEGLGHRVFARGLHISGVTLGSFSRLSCWDPSEEQRHRRAAEERQHEEDDALGAAEALSELTLRNETDF